MAVLHAIRNFQKSARLTQPLFRIPKCVRQAFQIYRIYADGIFQLEDRKGKEKDLYDRAYLFADMNYINKNDEEKREVLMALMQFLNAMNADFKITAMNVSRNTEQYLDGLYREQNREAYPEVSKGMREWREELEQRGSMGDVNRLLYLTVTVRALRYTDAKTYFSSLEIQLARLFQAFDSRIFPLQAGERLAALGAFFRGQEQIEDDSRGLGKLPAILPVSLDADKDYLDMGCMYASVLTAREYASSLREDRVFQCLSTLPYPSICTIDVAPTGQAALKDMLAAAHINQERTIATEIDTKRKRGLAALGTSYAKEKQREELEAYQDQVEENNESGFLAGLLVVVTAQSEEELRQRIEGVQAVSRENGVKLELYHWVQIKALNTALPIGCRLVDNLRAFLTSSFVALQPFYAQELQEAGGVLYGLNRTTGNLVIGNRKRLYSPHGIVIGHTGSGKSFFLKSTEISQVLLGTDDDLICIDPQNELQEICREFGGQFLSLEAQGECHINPLEIPEQIFDSGDELRKNQFIADQCAWASAFCESIMKNMVYTQEHRVLVNRCVRNLYQRAFAQKKRKWQPTLVDLRQEIEDAMGRATEPSEASILRRIYNSLEEQVGGSSDLFSHQSNVTFQNRLLVFGLKKVDPEDWLPVMTTVMHFLTNRMTYNQQHDTATRMIVDETQVICAQKSSADILLKAVTTYRKFGGICTLVFQNLSRVLENPELRDMLSNCGYKCIFDQGGVDAAALREIQELSDVEYQSLAEAVPGYCLMIWGTKTILLDARMSGDNCLYEKFSTNFHEKKERRQEAGDPLAREGTLDVEILRIAQAVPVGKEELQELLPCTPGELDAALQRLCREGRLEAVPFAGKLQYRTGKGDGL